MTHTHFFRCLSCEREHGEAEAAAKCCPFMQEIFRCNNCEAEFASKARLSQHQRRNAITECEAVMIADGIDAGTIEQATNWQGPAGCFARA